MKKQLTLSLLAFFLVTSHLMADPPEPPTGKVWVLNHQMSDEFDVNSPDLDKWNVFGKSNSWDRTSAFDERIHEVEKEAGTDNYYLTMNPMWYYEDERFTSSGGRTYNFAGGGMDTKELQTYGYFEVRVKPSDFPMGSGVFMNSRATSAGSCNEKYHSELDIIENMGFTGPFTGSHTGSFNNIQHVNSHAKPYSDASGSCQALSYESTNSGVSGKALAAPLGFNTVGMWWQDANTAKFYNNDSYFGTITPHRDFNLPMPVIIVMETYGWGSDENNATNPKPVEWMFENDFRTKAQRAVVYDWVRVWKLVDIDETTFNNSVDNIEGQESSLSVYPSTNLGATFFYSAKASRSITATLSNPSGNILAVKEYTVSQGVRSIYAEFTLDENLAIANGYSIKYEMKDGTTIVKTSTSTVNVVAKPLEKKLWREGIPTSLEPGKSNYTIDVKYETDTASTIVIEVRKPDGSWYGSGSKHVSAGNDIASISVNTSTTTSVGTNYFFKVYMYRKGMDWRDPLNVAVSPTVYFDFAEAISPSIAISSVPTNIASDAESIDVTFDYASHHNGIVTIDLLDPQGVLAAQELRTERSGSRSLTRTIDIENTLSPSDDYSIAIRYIPEGGVSATLVDTVFNITVEGSTNIRQIKEENSLELYPNPGNGLVYLRLADTNIKLDRVEIYNLNGQQKKSIVAESNDGEYSLDLTGLTPGVYIVKAISANQVFLKNYIVQ